jgi:hypothetical protein
LNLACWAEAGCTEVATLSRPCMPGDLLHNIQSVALVGKPLAREVRGVEESARRVDGGLEVLCEAPETHKLGEEPLEDPTPWVSGETDLVCNSYAEFRPQSTLFRRH